MKLLRTIPALPVSTFERSVEFYRDKLGFTLAYKEEGFARFERDSAEIHLWAACDESWRNRQGGLCPVSSESFVAGTASCRIEVVGVDELYGALKPLGILHGKGEICDRW